MLSQSKFFFFLYSLDIFWIRKFFLVYTIFLSSLFTQFPLQDIVTYHRSCKKEPACKKKTQTKLTSFNVGFISVMEEHK